jgi:hypothetical protein
MAKRRNKRRKTAFVPRVIFATALVGASVVPACVAACGGRTTNSGSRFIGGDVAAAFGVGNDGFCNCDVGQLAFGGDVATGDFGVAIDAFVAPDASDATVGDARFVGPDGVASQAFGSGDVADVSIED